MRKSESEERNDSVLTDEEKDSIASRMKRRRNQHNQMMMTTKTTVMYTSLWERKSNGSNDILYMNINPKGSKCIYLNLTTKLNKNFITVKM